jgi:hypothetical protein
MAYSDPAHWRGRAKEMRVLAEQMDECVSKQMVHRIAEDYERLAQTAEQRVKDAPPPPVAKTAAKTAIKTTINTVVVPAEARRFAPRRKLVGTPPRLVPDLQIPGFLKRGPATAEEVGAPVGSGPEILMRIASEFELAPVSCSPIAMSEPELHTSKAAR